MQKIDQAWIAEHPLPAIAESGDKNARGRVIVIGGAEFVPGALRLTGEAVLRAGAGKLQMATVKAAAMSLAVLMPEAAMIALPADNLGEIAADAFECIAEKLDRCDALIMGPGMSATPHTAKLVASVLCRLGPETTLILDAAALTCARNLGLQIAAREGRVVMTPHHRELSFLTGTSEAEIRENPVEVASAVAQTFQATVLLKSRETILVAPDEDPLLFEGGCVGLATGGSGDVLAGIIGGLVARGAAPRDASAWAAYVHGKAGEILAREIGSVGFLARELLPLIPVLIDAANIRGTE